ncbi:MAG: MFS transporter [Marmoricola sp.]
MSTETVSDPRRWKALFVLCLIQFMLILDVTVVNVALPHIQSSLKVTSSDLAWVVDAYVLAAGGLLLLGGRLADLLGRRATFLAGVAVFGLASATCGFAVNGDMLIVSRFIQGAGEALAAPASLGLIAVMFHDPQERIKALGAFGGVAGLGGTTGTVISGFLVQWADWRWVFFINIPVALIAIVLVPRLVSESKATVAHRPDFVGAITGTGGLIAVVYGLLSASTHSWGSANVLVPLIGGVALLGLMVLIEARSDDPLIPLDFFRNRTRVVTNIVTLFFASAFFSYFFLLTLVEQQHLGWSPIQGGLSYLPFGLSIGAAIGLGTGLMPRLGVKRLLAAGFFLDAVGLGLTSSITSDTNYWTQILPGMILLGLGSGVSFPAIGNAALHEVTGEDSSLASGVQQAFQQVGGAIGLATLATLAVRYSTSHIGVHGPDFIGGTVLSFRIGTVLLVIGGIAVMVFLEHVLAVPRNPLVEVAAAEAEPGTA